MSGTAVGRSVFLFGRELDGNREVHVVESGSTYDFDSNTLTNYANAETAFPYTEGTH